jgi:hypothetical protein
MIAAANTMTAACPRPRLTSVPRVLARLTGCGLPDVVSPRFDIPFPAKMQVGAHSRGAQLLLHADHEIAILKLH